MFDGLREAGADKLPGRLATSPTNSGTVRIRINGFFGTMSRWT
jgi:hypothetical protein